MMTIDQFWEELSRRIETMFARLVDRLGFILTNDGKIAAINGQFADVYLNGSTTATPGIPIVTTQNLAVGDEVVVFCRNKYDKVVLYKKVINST